MHHIFIDRGYKALYKPLVQKVCDYVQLAKAIVKTDFNVALWVTQDKHNFYLFIYFFFVVSQGYKSFDPK